jgi:hypothetical protein
MENQIAGGRFAISIEDISVRVGSNPLQIAFVVIAELCGHHRIASNRGAGTVPFGTPDTYVA